MSVVKPKFPEDFKVLYAEGASYWWWSPFTDESFDGTVLAGETWPAGVVVGDGEQYHELVAGEGYIVLWMDSELAPLYAVDGVYDPTRPEEVQRAVDDVFDAMVLTGAIPSS